MFANRTTGSRGKEDVCDKIMRYEFRLKKS